MTRRATAAGSAGPYRQALQPPPRGGFALGMVLGLLLGLGVALAVALYITKAPVPFVNKVPQRTAEQDAAEAERNRTWDPNAPLAGKNPARPQAPASDVASLGQPAADPAAVPASAAPARAAASKPAAVAAAASAAPAPKPAASRPARDPAAILAGQSEAGAAARPAAPEAAATPAKPPSGVAVQFFVQAGAFSVPEDAEAQRAKVALVGLSARVMAREQAGRTVYRVRVGPFDNRNAAEDVQDKLTGAGIEANLVRVER